jgi:phosphomannomutase/phosphoglucomutase
MPEKEKVLKEAEFKSFDWADKPVIHDSMFREYDLRAATIPLTKKGKPIIPGVNNDGFRVLGQAYGTYVKNTLKQSKAIVSNDYRSYSRGLAYSFMTGLMSTGVDVIDIGTSLTPILFFAQYQFKMDAAAIVTASHNDNGWAGVKPAKGLSRTVEADDIQGLKKIAHSGKFAKGSGSYERFYGIKDIYIKDIVEKYKKLVGKRKLKVVVGTANGGAGEFLPDVIRTLGFDVIESHCKLDWDFPNFNPNPENVKFLKEFGEAVVKNKADFGIAADGDGDRFGCVDEKGQIIYSDRAGLMIARFLSEKTKGKPIAIDVKSTGAFAIDPVLKKNKVDVVFTKTGHSYVKQKTQEIDALAGFEKSGHFFLRDEYGRGYDDGCLASAMFAVIMSNQEKTVSEMIAEQPKSFQSPTMEPAVADDKVKYEIVEKMKKEFMEMKKKGEKLAGKEIKELITINGTRVILEDGSWGLVRCSSNQPVLVLVIESFSEKKLMYDIFDQIQSMLEKYGVRKEHYDQLLPPYKGEQEE